MQKYYEASFLSDILSTYFLLFLYWGTIIDYTVDAVGRVVE